MPQHIYQLATMLSALIENLQNTGTIPLCLWEWKHEINKSDLIVPAAFGGGFTWGTT